MSDTIQIPLAPELKVDTSFQYTHFYMHTSYISPFYEMNSKCIEFQLRSNPLSPNHTKWSTTLKQFVTYYSTNCLNAFHHFVELMLKGLRTH